MTRPDWDEYGLGLAEAVSSRADCTRRKVGCVIMRPDHSIVATGYNGAPAGGLSCLAGDCPRGRASTDEVPGYDQPGGSSYDIGPGSCIALHDAQNAIARATWDEMQDATLYSTHQPCTGCARFISGTPIIRVVWPQGIYRVLNGRLTKFERPFRPRSTHTSGSIIDLERLDLPPIDRESVEGVSARSVIAQILEEQRQRRPE